MSISLRDIAIGIVLFISTSLLIAPTLSVFLLGLQGTISPLQVTLFFNQHGITYYLLSLLLIALVTLMVMLALKAGIYRYFSVVICFSVLGVLAGILVGQLLFMFWQHITISNLNPLLALAIYQHLPMYLQKSYLFCLLTGNAITCLGIFALKKENYHLLGDAHFANPIEMNKAGYFKPDGILLGKAWGSKLYVGGFEHVLGFAPTGSGKTTSIAIPNLLSWQGSCIANDVKKTLWDKTKQFRQETLVQQCYLWAPTDDETHCYNPLDLIGHDASNIVADCQRLSHILVPVDVKGELLWGQQARQLLVALLLYVLQTENETKTLGLINALLKQHDFDEWLAAQTEVKDLHDVFYQNAYSYLNQPDKTRGSTLTTLTGHFEIFGDPKINYATSKTDFDIKRLRTTSITVYIGIPPSDLARLSPLITLFWEQVIHTMLSRLPDQNEQVPVLCLLDEFGALKRMDMLRQGLKLLREYRVRCVLLVQQLSQLREHYTRDEAESFLSIKTKIAFTPDSLEDAEYISKLLGNKTVRVKAGSTSHHETGGSTTKSYNYQSVPLMRSEKIMGMNAENMLILKSGHSPVNVKKNRWYADKAFKNINA